MYEISIRLQNAIALTEDIIERNNLRRDLQSSIKIKEAMQLDIDLNDILFQKSDQEIIEF